MKRGASILLMVLVVSGSVLAQQLQDQLIQDDAKRLLEYPELKIPAGYSLKSLPTSKDNTATNYFPEVFNQYGWSCNQASSIGYVFTYELNAMRDASAAQLENIYPPLSVWNFLNDGNAENGVSFFDSWEVIRKNGVPNFIDFGYEDNFEKKWMSGYDKYYRGMHNKPQEIYTIKTDTEEGILNLKAWVNDHMDGSRNGGVASFQIGSGGMKMVQIPEGEEKAGKYLMTSYAQHVGHAMTVVGWNDNVRWDYNADGEYTNDIDLNGDGIIDIRDHENGAFLVVNSWGQGWGDKGRVYVPYRLFAMEPIDGGIWEQCVTVVKPFAEYSPKLTFKVGLTYTKRSQIKVVAGVSQNTSDSRPAHVLEFPCFNYRGGYIPMQGFDMPGSDFLEFGLDVSPLLEFVTKGQPAKFFLEVYEQQGDEAAGNGKVNYFSVMDYGLEQVIESSSPATDENIMIDAVTRLFAFVAPQASVPVVATEALPQAEVGVGYITSVSASGGEAPYTWIKPEGQYMAYKRDEGFTWPAGAELVLGISDTSRMVVDLGFSFEFYGESYEQVVLLKDGGIVMGTDPRVYPYVIDNRLFAFQNRGIFPFFTDLEYRFMGDGVYRKDVADGVIFAWDATLSKYAGVYDPKFGIKINKNGDFYYGFNTVALTAEWDWISVVSAGDQLRYTLPDINQDALYRGKVHYDFRPFAWPEWLFLTPNGGLLGSPPETASSMWLPFTVSDKNGLHSTKSLFLDVKGGTGIGDVAKDTDVKVYPNPVGELLYIELGDKAVSNVYVINSVGQVVLSKEVELGQSRIKLDVKGLEEGVYFVKIGDVVQKVVVR